MDFIVLAILNVIFYIRTIGYGCIIDDLAAQERLPEVKTQDFWVNLWRQFKQDYMESPALGHLFSFTLHTINTMLIYVLFGRTPVAMLTAALFCINPVNNMAAVWMSGRPYSLATMFILIGFCFPILFPIVYPIAFLWSINSTFSPLMFVVLGMPWMAVMLPIMGIVGSKTHINTLKLRHEVLPEYLKKFEIRNLILVFKTVGYYTLLCIFPIRLGMCHSYLHSFGFSREETEKWYKLDWFFAAGIALIAFGIMGSIYFGMLFMFGFIWYLAHILQWCNWKLITHPITERYLYLANVGLMFFLAKLIIGTGFEYAFLTLYAILNWKYIPVYKNCLVYWKSNVENFPDVAMGYNQYGLELKARKYLGTAFDVYIAGLKVRPNDFRLSFNSSFLLIEQGRFDIIGKFLLNAEKNLPEGSNGEMFRPTLNKMKEECAKHGLIFEDGVPVVDQKEPVKEEVSKAEEKGAENGTDIPGLTK